MVGPFVTTSCTTYTRAGVQTEHVVLRPKPLHLHISTNGFSGSAHKRADICNVSRDVSMLPIIIVSEPYISRLTDVNDRKFVYFMTREGYCFDPLPDLCAVLIKTLSVAYCKLNML